MARPQHALTSGSVHAEVLPWAMCLPTLVPIAEAVVLLERRQTDSQSDVTERFTPHWRLYSRHGNELSGWFSLVEVVALIYLL